jgi:hypothetical protein
MNWNNLPEDILDACAWSTSKKAWQFHPRDQAEAIYYNDERTMLNEAARYLGYGSLDDAISYG